MPPTGPVPPRIARETRLLLIVALVSLAALWILARLRFPDREISTNPLPPVLTQLAPRSPLEEIPALVGEVMPRLAPALLPVPLDAGAAPGARRSVAALRIREEFAVALIEGGKIVPAGFTLAGRDGASGLTVFRVPPQGVPDVPVWTPRRTDAPRFLLATETAGEIVSLRPLFVGALLAHSSALWPGSVWLAAADAPPSPGSYVFTIEGALAGLAVTSNGRPAIVPAEQVIALVQQLIDGRPAPRGELGIRVQPLTPAIAAASGSVHGVVVTSVDPHGPAAGQLRATDVIEAIGGTPILTADDWRARSTRVSVAERIAILVRRGGQLQEVTIAPAAPEDAELPHGLVLRTRRGEGAEVVSVAPDSAAAAAGLEPGDLITVFDGTESPTAPEVIAALAKGSADRPLLAAVTRGSATFVLTVARR